MSHHLDGCRERIERAKAHLVALLDEIDTWPGSTVSYEPRYDPDTGWHAWHVDHVVPPPLKLGVIASDYIHQLRSTLDNLVASLAELNEAPPERSHSFPMVEEEPDWKGAAGSQLKGLRADHVLEIETTQPFKAEYDPALHPLAVLRRLSNRDKHEVITPTMASHAGTGPIASTKPGIEIVEVISTEGKPLEAGRDMLRIRTDPPDPDPAFEPEDGGIQVYMSFGDPPINRESLERIGAVVHDVVERAAFQT